MKLSGIAITAGLGAVAGAVAILAMPRNNPTRKLMTKAAHKAEDLAWRLEDRMNQGGLGM